MKTTKTLFLLFLTVLTTISCSQENMDDDLLPQADNKIIKENKYFDYTLGEGPFVHFEDTTFKEILLNDFDINTNRDNQISYEEASSYDGMINVSYKNINSLIGIEKFVNLTILICSRNNLEVLDVSKNINLKQLECGNNPFDVIDLKQNINLTRLDIRTTNITTLDLSRNPNLRQVNGVCNYYLKTVNIQNGNNDKIGTFFFGNKNLALECVQVDDVDYPDTVYNWNIPEHTVYSLDCFAVNIPHASMNK